MCTSIALLIAWQAGTQDLTAQERLVRRYAGEQGLVVPPVSALAQDSVGFLWIGTQGGLHRYDGIEFRRWAPDLVVGAVTALAASHDGRVAAVTPGGSAFEIAGHATRPIPPPAKGWSSFATLAYDDADRLWSVDGDGALVYRAGSEWNSLPHESLAGERARAVRVAGSRGILALTDAGVWHVGSPGQAPRKRFDARAADALLLPDDRLMVLTSDGRVVERSGGATRELASRDDGGIPVGRPITLAERNGTIWVSLDRYLLALRPGQPVQYMGTRYGLDSGGPLLTDREGSLWLGSFAALFQFPEPETVLWNDLHGLPGRHTRYVARSDDVLWITSWQGTGQLREEGAGLTAVSVGELPSISPLCTDSLGTVWLVSGDDIVRVRGRREIARVPGSGATMYDCAHAPGPGLWINTSHGLLYADAVRGTIARVDGPPPEGDDAGTGTVFQDSRDRVWATRGTRICHVSVASLLAIPRPGVRRVGASMATPHVRDPGPDTWTCERIPGAGSFTALIEHDDGTLWAATYQAGVFARRDDAWRPIPAAATLPSRSVFAMVPSPTGGVWIAGHGFLLRVRSGGADGWEVLESPDARNGLTSVGGSDVLEDDDGSLWIATSLGLLQVPPRARFAASDGPRVVLVDGRVDEEPIHLDGTLELTPERNRLELRFAALSYRAPGSVRYQVRLSPDAPWSSTQGVPSFRWVHLRPGSYRAEVRASIDGLQWSANPAAFAFRVLPPWYARPWALLLFSLAAAALLWIAYRARLAFLLGLERQRTRIAMDLHDELGSGLGSIGILAGLLAGGRLGPSEHDRIAKEVADTAEEMGNALGDIVWSLDRRAATLGELASRLAARGERLFASDDVAFRVQSPHDVQTVRLPLKVRRNVLLIGLEALYNTARHARASRVVLTVSHRGALGRLTIADNGVGFGGATPCNARGGRGIPGMRQRAAEVGAAIEWSETPGGGTTVTLRFALPGRTRMSSRLTRAMLRARLRRDRRSSMA